MASLIRRIKTKINHLRFNRNPLIHFHSNEYLRHTSRRLEHLASLGLDIAHKNVLEVGAGVGDHTCFYLDRDCQVTITEARPENIQYLKKRFPKNEIYSLDMDNPVSFTDRKFDICHCYGLLYHLEKPYDALRFLSERVQDKLFLETCVSFDEQVEENLIAEIKNNPTQAISGTGCRPSRKWIYETLNNFFQYVYMPHTQPNHDEFPLDWNSPDKQKTSLVRSVFIASNVKIENPLLSESLLMTQIRQG